MYQRFVAKSSETNRKSQEKNKRLKGWKCPYCVKKFDVFWKIKQPSHSNHLEERRGEETISLFVFSQARRFVSLDRTGWTQVNQTVRRVVKNLLAYPMSLWAVWGINKVTSPRKGGGPSRHHELRVKTQQKQLFQHFRSTLTLKDTGFKSENIVPHTLWRRYIKPCWGCRQSWLCLDGRACGLPSDEVQRTVRRKHRPAGWRSSLWGSASEGSLWLEHLVENKNTHTW